MDAANQMDIPLEVSTLSFDQALRRLVSEKFLFRIDFLSFLPLLFFTVGYDYNLGTEIEILFKLNIFVFSLTS